MRYNELVVEANRFDVIYARYGEFLAILKANSEEAGCKWKQPADGVEKLTFFGRRLELTFTYNFSEKVGVIDIFELQGDERKHFDRSFIDPQGNVYLDFPHKHGLSFQDVDDLRQIVMGLFGNNITETLHGPMEEEVEEADPFKL